MSLISPKLWDSEFPDMPMPENCTYEMFAAACKQKSDDDNLKWSTDYIAKLKKQRKNADPEKQKMIDELIKQEKERLL